MKHRNRDEPDLILWLNVVSNWNRNSLTFNTDCENLFWVRRSTGSDHFHEAGNSGSSDVAMFIIVLLFLDGFFFELRFVENLVVNCAFGSGLDCRSCSYTLYTEIVVETIHVWLYASRNLTDLQSGYILSISLHASETLQFNDKRQPLELNDTLDSILRRKLDKSFCSDCISTVHCSMNMTKQCFFPFLKEINSSCLVIKWFPARIRTETNVRSFDGINIICLHSIFNDIDSISDHSHDESDSVTFVDRALNEGPFLGTSDVMEESLRSIFNVNINSRPHASASELPFYWRQTPAQLSSGECRSNLQLHS